MKALLLLGLFSMSFLECVVGNVFANSVGLSAVATHYDYSLIPTNHSWDECRRNSYIDDSSHRLQSSKRAWVTDVLNWLEECFMISPWSFILFLVLPLLGWHMHCDGGCNARRNPVMWHMVYHFTWSLWVLEFFIWAYVTLFIALVTFVVSWWLMSGLILAVLVSAVGGLMFCLGAGVGECCQREHLEWEACCGDGAFTCECACCCDSGYLGDSSDIIMYSAAPFARKCWVFGTPGEKGVCGLREHEAHEVGDSFHAPTNRLGRLHCHDPQNDWQAWNQRVYDFMVTDSIQPGHYDVSSMDFIGSPSDSADALCNRGWPLWRIPRSLQQLGWFENEDSFRQGDGGDRNFSCIDSGAYESSKSVGTTTCSQLSEHVVDHLFFSKMWVGPAECLAIACCNRSLHSQAQKHQSEIEFLRGRWAEIQLLKEAAKAQASPAKKWGDMWAGEQIAIDKLSDDEDEDDDNPWAGQHAATEAEMRAAVEGW